MKFCSECGSAVLYKIPNGDDRPRHVCDGCGTIHYQNPKVVAGCIPEWEDQILLCRRAIEPRLGLWTLPAGFMENGESTEQAAARETWEEAQATMEQVTLYCLYSIPYINQVYLFFRGRFVAGRFGVGAESLEVALFREQQIPWDQLAFPVVNLTLQRYFRERREGQYSTYVGEIDGNSGVIH